MMLHVQVLIHPNPKQGFLIYFASLRYFDILDLIFIVFIHAIPLIGLYDKKSFRYADNDVMFKCNFLYHCNHGLCFVFDNDIT